MCKTKGRGAMKKKVSFLCVLALLVQLLIPFSALAENETDGAQTEYTQLETPTVTYNMNIDWKYKRAADNATFPLAAALDGVKDTSGKNFYDVGYDDSTWETVSLPHAINAVDSFDGLGVDAGETGLYRGFMFYRKNITVPETDAGKKFVIEFEAFRQSVYVYVNGEMAGYYEAGVVPVGFDLTDYIVAGADNVIAVATDNTSYRGSNSVTQETIPGHTPGDLSGYRYQWNTKDFNEVQGGLTGNVKLHAMNKIYQTLPLYSNMKTMGNYIYGKNFDLRENSADITVEAEVRNETGEDKDITLQVDIVDNDGVLVASFESDAKTVPAATDTEDDQFLTVVPENAYETEKIPDTDDDGNTVMVDAVIERNSAPTDTVEVEKITAEQNVSGLKFWSDVSPNLYTVYTYLKDGDEIIDSQKTVTGFREVVYDETKGLQINGKTTYLKGYAQRSTNEWAAIGVANDWLSDIDMQLVKESNANFIRWMHIAPNPVDIRAGDKYGVVSIVPAGDKEGDVSRRAWDQRMETMRDVIIYFRNSPSAIFYEAGNNQITAAHMQAMTDLRKELDPNGYRFMGCRTISSQDQIAAAEWAGTMLNRHGSNAYASMKAIGKYIPILETEYHRNEAPRRVWDDFSPPYYDYVNKYLGAGASKTDGYDIWDQTQEDFSRTMFNESDGYSYYYNNRVGGVGKNEYSGAAMMVWSDSNMHVRNCGVENARTSGRVDAIRVKKESFYAIQAAQSTEPKIHILGHWNYPEYIKDDRENGNYWYEDKTWNGTYWEPNGTFLQRDPTKKTVYVIGSEGIAKVELYVNDELAGTDTSAENNYIYAFDNIDVTQSGKISAKAYNEREEVIAEHEIKTAGEAAQIKLTPVLGPDGFLADGSDLAYIDVSVVDAEGNVCPLDERKITFAVSDDSKVKFIGGYNSGYYGDGLSGDGDRIVNHKNYVFAECGINRVFLQSTREAGEFTVTATAEGMQPAQLTLNTEEFLTEGGLTTTDVSAWKQGAVPTPAPTAQVPSMKVLSDTFVADWTEETGNVVKVTTDKKDYYTVKVDGEELVLTNKAFKPDSSTGVVGEINPILDALKESGLNFDYTYAKDTGVIPEVLNGQGASLPLITITTGTDTVYVANGSTVVAKNSDINLTNYQIIANSDNSALIAELSSVLGYINGVSFTVDEENKVFDITVEKPMAELMADDNESALPLELSYKNGAVTVKDVSDTDEVKRAAVIFAGYDSDMILRKVEICDVDYQNGIPVPDGMGEMSVVKAMVWDSVLGGKPMGKSIYCTEDEPQVTITPMPVPTATPTATPNVTIAPTPTPELDVIYKYDKVLADCKCDTAVQNGVVSEDTSPDGTAYLTATDGDICLPGIGYNSKEDLMWEADVRFNNDGSSIIPRDEGDKKFGSCIKRHGNTLAIEKSSNNFAEYGTVDPTAWYKIVLIGRYSAADANIDMIVYKYNDDGTKELVGKYDNVSTRNLYANSNNGASHWNAGGGISVDNARITLLGADKINMTSDSDTIKAGNTMQFDYSATRQGAYITKPSVTWAVYNADDTAPLEDENISITANGVLNVGLDAQSQTINVRATAESGVYAAKAITVSAVDISDVKFDTLTLSTTDEYVSSEKSMTITAKATKDGAEVTLADSDLIWYATDSTNMVKLGDNLKWIKIENGVVTVDPKAVTQDITVRAADPDDKVRGSIAVHIKASDALEGNEDGAKDRLLFSSNGEQTLENTESVLSVDGTHAYKATAGYVTGNIAETAGDIVVEMDIKFAAAGAGFQPAKTGKVNTCVVYKDGQLAVQTASNSFTKYAEVSSDKWYHITLIRKQGAYAHIILEEYDDDGNRTNRKVIKDVNQRNDQPTAFININSGTVYDNLRILSPVPTDIEISTDVETVFAGETAKATAVLYWNEVEMKNPDSTLFEYKIYDSENKYPLDSDLITVNADGVVTVDAMADTQDVYVRAVAKQSGKSASAKLSVKPSDIVTINKLGIDAETESKFATLFVTKNFFYSDDIMFITQIFDENNVLKHTYTKAMYGDALTIGENEVTLNIEMPEDFDKTKDTVKIYALTKLSANDATAADGTLTVTKNKGNAVITAAPTYDVGSDVAVLVLKADADETDVKESDILYFDVLSSTDAASATLAWAQTYDGDYVVKTAGKVSGVLKVVTDGSAVEETE